ncbi:MAG TPA: HNH endonuclease [Solirubrobacteraceae bacterium]|jgi:hypothetical protein|nr:HNH endonuclease [Solirubrobacteraceae bacterium]
MPDVDTRCTYCLQVKPASSFTQQGDHVIPAVLGGAWVDRRVCDDCNPIANTAADELIAKDAVVRFLRDAYGIRDRYGHRPDPARFAVRLPDDDGVIKVTLGANRATFTPGMAPEVADRLGLANASQQRLQEYVVGLLDLDPEHAVDSLVLARAARHRATAPTPPLAWSRFMVKVGLACGREAYGDEWLDGPHAAIMSEDLLGGGKPRFDQPETHPPIAVAWPYQPPKHVAWIERYQDVAVLLVVLFGQLHGGVPINAADAEYDLPSAWSLDPQRRSVHRTTYPATYFGSAAAVVTKAGGTAIMVDHPEHPFIFIPDGPDGPVDLPVDLPRAESAIHALELLTDDEPSG